MHHGRQHLQKVHIVKKAPSSWRREGSEEVPCRIPRNGSQTRFQVDNPHGFQEKRARSTSLNPVIYPVWWGEEHEIDADYYRRDRRHIPKRLKSAEIGHKAKVYRPVAKHCEDTLDRRLRQVHEDVRKDQNLQPVAYRYGEESGVNTSDSMHQLAPNGKFNNSYAYTAMNNVSPIRAPIHGQSNVPMTYDGPPTHSEVNRNRGRKDYNRRSFEFGYEVQQDVQIEDGAGIRRRKDLGRHHHQHLQQLQQQ